MNAYSQKKQEVGRRIRQARKAAGLSHDKLGAQVGTSRQHLIRLEQGQHMPGAKLVARIAEATGKPFEFFGADEDEDEASDRMYAELAARLAAVLADQQREMNALVRREIARSRDAA